MKKTCLRVALGDGTKYSICVRCNCDANMLMIYLSESLHQEGAPIIAQQLIETPDPKTIEVKGIECVWENFSYCMTAIISAGAKTVEVKVGITSSFEDSEHIARVTLFARGKSFQRTLPANPLRIIQWEV